MAKKPGGTFFGNLLRAGAQAGQKALGLPSIFGSGKNMIPLDGDVRNMWENEKAINKVMYDNPPVSPTAEFDLGKYIKLPTIQTNNALDTKNIAMIALGVLAVGYILKKL